MVNGEDILLKQHNFDNFVAVLLQQLVIHSNSVRLRMYIIQKMLLWISEPFGMTYHMK